MGGLGDVEECPDEDKGADGDGKEESRPASDEHDETEFTTRSANSTVYCSSQQAQSRGLRYLLGAGYDDGKGLGVTVSIPEHNADADQLYMNVCLICCINTVKVYIIQPG